MKGTEISSSALRQLLEGRLQYPELVLMTWMKPLVSPLSDTGY